MAYLFSFNPIFHFCQNLSKISATRDLNEKIKSLSHFKKSFLLGKSINTLFCSFFVVLYLIKKWVLKKVGRLYHLRGILISNFKLKFEGSTVIRIGPRSERDLALPFSTRWGDKIILGEVAYLRGQIKLPKQGWQFHLNSMDTDLNLLEWIKCFFSSHTAHTSHESNAFFPSCICANK